ncbi:MAG TPA: FAD-dependent oxidoreductase [Lachnospiraceae bacterium]|nr:FAD-dependent oxidoreductase [Lachnospiraceae bacterium]
MIIIKDSRQKIGYTKEDLIQTIKKKLKVKSDKEFEEEVISFHIYRESLDSRKHDDIHYVVSISVNLKNEGKFLKLVNNKNIMLTKPKKYTFPHILNTEIREYIDINPDYRPVIVGSGPAGYHAALKLSYAGFKPIVLERGRAVEERIHDIDSFWNNNKLDTDSNVCFGEGGAGTFSDGKLNTGNKDKGGYFKEVLDTFVRYGAPESVGYMAKPHIGTDVLRDILVKMRNDIIRLGGEVRFSNKLIDIDFDNDQSEFGYETENPRYELTVDSPDGIYKISTYSVILAIGHSARDTFKMLYNHNYQIEKKPFAIGVRAEHKAEDINKAMYGDDFRKLYGDSLPTADYKLTYHTRMLDEERSVFSFCMCPGGYVVNSSTEEDGICINGMSYKDRAGENSNSAIIVNINPEDYKDYKYEGIDVLGGLSFQQELEKAAFKAGDGLIPVTTYKDMKEDRVTDSFGTVKPNICGKYKMASIKDVLPEYVYNAILEAMPYFGKRIKGYDNPDTVISAVEARSSSPVRIVRNEHLMAEEYPGIFPCGEGAGYAGGITSAAADGIKTAEALSEYLVDDLIESYKAYEISKYV